MTTILPNDSLHVITDVHFYIDGLIPITYGGPIGFEGDEWFYSDNCNCIVGDVKGAVLPYAEFRDSFWILRKGPRSIHIFLVCLSL